MNSHNKHEKVAAPALQSIRLLDQVRERVRHLHYSLQTEKSLPVLVAFSHPLAWPQWHDDASARHGIALRGQ
jgi:predicted transcriptional regulator